MLENNDIGDKSSDNLILMSKNSHKFERRLYRYKSHKIIKDTKELDQDEIDYIKSKKANEREPRKRVKTFIKIRSSKSVRKGLQGITSNRNISKYVEEIVPDILDNTYINISFERMLIL